MNLVNYIAYVRKVARIILLLTFLIPCFLHAQQTVTIGGTELKSEAVLYLIPNGNQGLLLPAIGNINSFNPADAGMVVFNNADNKVHYWNGSQWIEVGGGASGGGDTYSLRLVSNNLELLINGGVQDQVALTDFTLGGDLSGNIQSATLVSINGQSLPSGTPATDQVLAYNGTSWEYRTIPTGTFTGIVSDATLSGDGTSGSPLSVTSVNDADADPANEIQTISFDGTTNTLSLTEPGQPDQTADLSSLAGSGSLTAGTGISITTGVVSNTGDVNATDDMLIATYDGNSNSIVDNSESTQALQGTAVVATTPTNGQVLQFSAGQWQPATLSGTGDLLSANNLSDLANASTARTNLGLQGLAIQSAVSGGTAGDITDNTIVDADINANADIAVSKLGPPAAKGILTTNGTTVTWLTEASANRVFGTDLSNNLVGRPVVLSTSASLAPDNSGIRPSATASDANLVSEAAVREAIDASSAGFSTANEVPRGDGTGLTSSSIFSNGSAVGIGGTFNVLYTLNVGGESNFEDVVYYGGDEGTSGDILTSDGGSGPPAWTDPGSLGLAADLQDAYDGGGTIQLSNADPGFTINSSVGNPLLVTDNTNFRMGIGTSSPGLILEVEAVTDGEPANSGTTASGVIRHAVQGSPIVLDVGIADDSYSGAWLQAHHSTDQSIHQEILLNPNGGNIGIGTTAPNVALHVNNASTGSAIQLTANGQTAATDGLSIVMNSLQQASILNRENQPLYLGTNGATRLAIQGDGDVGIGTVTPGSKLHVRHLGGVGQSSLGEGLSLSNATRTSTWEISHEYSAIASFEDLQFSYNGSLVATIAQNGDYSAISDKRLKKDIRDLNNVLETVMKLRPVHYRFKKGDGNEEIGLIAQEVLELFPALVSGTGGVKSNGEVDYYTMSYANMSVVSIKAIQEQQEIIARQQDEINQLKAALAKSEASSTKVETELETLKAQVSKLANIIQAEARNASNR
ncbi:hypothetical protein FNH22_03730 [Fulvivirga sp. M361]|uniref:tail fiber domain-containing protein n=1 Tax=Fulvivirga sp. M361 TaxID=2594266 RepID=UPI0011799298|nr:tail fiber domain-containing protein [Fulvivirga sp. M361]TRX61175.1 hypothetical protein FNH22_03730 [Fulvivirga sp. M361]